MQLDIKITDLETNSQTAVNYAYNNMSINIPVAHNGNVMRKNQIAAWLHELDDNKLL